MSSVVCVVFNKKLKVMIDLERRFSLSVLPTKMKDAVRMPIDKNIYSPSKEVLAS